MSYEQENLKQSSANFFFISRYPLGSIIGLNGSYFIGAIVVFVIFAVYGHLFYGLLGSLLTCILGKLLSKGNPDMFSILFSYFGYKYLISPLENQIKKREWEA